MTIQPFEHDQTATKPAVFLSGSHSIKHLPFIVSQRLFRLIDRRLPVLIGDAGGADCAIQRFLADQGHRDVTVFCAARTARHNLGRWPVEQVSTGAPRGTAAFHRGKDREMARRAGAGLVLWDGHSPGSLANIHRLCARGCFVLVYLASSGTFLTLKADRDRADFPARHPIMGL